MKKKEINYVILSKEMHENLKLINELNSYGVFIFDGKWLEQYMILDIIEKLNNSISISNNDEIAILTNDLTEEVKENIKELAQRFKKIRIITNHSQKYKKLEEEIYEKSGTGIMISNNRKRALKNAKLIINFDFVEEAINQYNINENAIIINLEGKIKINQKRFSGTIITDYEVTFKDDIDAKEREEFYPKEILEEIVLRESKKNKELSEVILNNFEIVKKIIKKYDAKIEILYGINGILK